MRLIIGGAYQGKLSWTLRETGASERDVAGPEDDPRGYSILNQFHLRIQKWVKDGKNPLEETACILQANPNCAILCDEVGCGIVPIEAFEREWREQTGRVCCMLAQRAVRVDRVFCGISQVLKDCSADKTGVR